MQLEKNKLSFYEITLCFDKEEIKNFLDILSAAGVYNFQRIKNIEMCGVYDDQEKDIENAKKLYKMNNKIIMTIRNKFKKICEE